MDSNSDFLLFSAHYIAGIIVKPVSFGVIISTLLIFLLLILSALLSAAEVAFFSLSPSDMDRLRESESRSDKFILQILDRPKRLLATMLISTNFLNIAIVILSTFITEAMFDFSDNPTLGFIIQVGVVTFMILMVGEVIPKTYATQKTIFAARFMIYPVLFIEKIFYPISSFLIFSTSAIDKRIKPRGHDMSVDALSHALELTSESELQHSDRKILKGIVKFGDIDVKQIMKPRMDVTAVEYKISYKELLHQILHAGFSRIPVYKERFDNIAGVLYIKDLLAYIDKDPTFEWQKLIRPPFFVPENKKIDDLMKEFQVKKIHLAVVVDEFGGTSGIVTLEDVIEEIVGEINDEFDDDDLVYSKLDDSNYIFEGKIHLNDLCRILEIDGAPFEKVKGEADTLAGFLIELKGKLPEKNELILFNSIRFRIEAADNRKIKRVKVMLGENEKPEVKQ